MNHDYQGSANAAHQDDPIAPAIWIVVALAAAIIASLFFVALGEINKKDKQINNLTFLIEQECKRVGNQMLDLHYMCKDGRSITVKGEWRTTYHGGVSMNRAELTK